MGQLILIGESGKAVGEEDLVVHESWSAWGIKSELRGRAYTHYRAGPGGAPGHKDFLCPPIL